MLLRGRAAAAAVTAWQQVTADDIDATVAVAVAGLSSVLEQHQATAVRLTNRYAQQFVADELGRPRRIAAAPVDRWAGGSRVDGKTLSQAIGNGNIAAKAMIAQGMAPEAAVRAAGAQLLRNAGEEVMHPARAAMTEIVRETDVITGYRRVASGGACAACLALMDGATRDEPLEVHDHCSCTGEPVVRGVRETIVRPTGIDLVARMTQEQMVAQFGPATAEALRTGAAQLRDLVQREHYAALPTGITQAPLTAA